MYIYKENSLEIQKKLFKMLSNTFLNRIHFFIGKEEILAMSEIYRIR